MEKRKRKIKTEQLQFISMNENDSSIGQLILIPNIPIIFIIFPMFYPDLPCTLFWAVRFRSFLALFQGCPLTQIRYSLVQTVAHANWCVSVQCSKG